MVGFAACRSRSRFYRVEAALGGRATTEKHGGWRNRAHTRSFAGDGAEEVAVDREDNVGLIEFVSCVDVLPESQLRTIAPAVALPVPLMPFRLGILLQIRPEAGRQKASCDDNGFSQNAKARTARGALPCDRSDQGNEERRITVNFVDVVNALQTIGIVKTEDRRLSGNVRGSKRSRMFRIAFYFGWTEFVRFDQNRIGDARNPERRGVEEGLGRRASFSGSSTYGMTYSTGCLVQAARPASASDAPMILRKLRRPSSSIHSEAWRGNSRCRNSLKPLVEKSSSRLRQ